MIQERNKPTFLRRLYPNTKLWMCLAIACSIIFLQNTWFSLGVMFISIIVIYLEKYTLEFKIVAFSITIMALNMFIINGSLNPINDYTKDPVFIIPLLNWKLYKEGLIFSLHTFQRIAPLMSALFLLFRTMNMTDLGVALNEGGLSYRHSFIFITTFQILPVLSKDMAQIMDAQKARGLDVEGSLFKRMSAFIPIMVPVVSNSIMKVQDQTIALETKGFNSNKPKTIYRNLEKKTIDHILKWLSIFCSIGTFIYWIMHKFFI